MAGQRYEISICYEDRGGTKRYVNNVGVLFLDGDRGNIILPPGVALVGGDGHYINVSVPRERQQGGGQQRQGGQQGGRGGGGFGGGRQGGGYQERGQQSSGDDDIPF